MSIRSDSLPCRDATGPLRLPHKKKTVFTRAVSTHSYEIYAVEVCSRTVTDLFIWSNKWLYLHHGPPNLTAHQILCRIWNYLGDNNYVPRFYRFRYERTARIVCEFQA